VHGVNIKLAKLSTQVDKYVFRLLNGLESMMSISKEKILIKNKLKNEKAVLI
jgi:uncharacterized membrane protein